MEYHLLATLTALAFLGFLLFRPWWRSPQMLTDFESPARWPRSTKPGEGEQQPETDRAPRSSSRPALLAGAVLVTAGVRVALLVALHA